MAQVEEDVDGGTKAIAKTEPEKKPSLLASARTTDDLPLPDAVKVLMVSGLVKNTEDSGKLMTKLNFGRSLDLPDVVSVNGIQIGPNQTVIMSAQLMSALINRSGKYRKVVKQRDLKGSAIEIFEKIGGEWLSCGVPITFGPEDAKRAGLDTKDTYRKWPVDMYYARCLAAAFRVYCSDCCAAQVYIPEEINNTGYKTNPESLSIEREYDAPPPKRGGSAATEAAPPQPQSKAGKEQLAKVNKLLSDTGADQGPFLEHYGAKAVKDLSPDQAEDLIRLLELKKKAM